MLVMARKSLNMCQRIMAAYPVGFLRPKRFAVDIFRILKLLLGNSIVVGVVFWGIDTGATVKHPIVSAVRVPSIEVQGQWYCTGSTLTVL